MGKGRWFLRPVGALQNALVQILIDNAIALALDLASGTDERTLKVTNRSALVTLKTMAGSGERSVPFGSEVGVSRQLARRRFEQLSELRYALDLRLSGESRIGQSDEPLTRLLGEARIRFCLRVEPEGEESLLLDFRDLQSSVRNDEAAITGGTIERMLVNGQLCDEIEQLNGHVVIPPAGLRKGENEILIRFSSPVAVAGRPLIRFDDPVNGDRFVYLLPVPMDASLAYPCFDQPDLKGRFSLSIVVPTGLKVISNSPLMSLEAAGADQTRYNFAETAPLSTYLFSFAVGRFASLEDDLDGLPLRLFVRRSQLERAATEWPALRDLTAAAIRSLVEYLECPFPFRKYDQVLLPGLPFRGMEHAGATYLREESILFPHSPSHADRHARTTLILHELVHQWFGDLVTMRWFDDLWIKEGFANLLAYQTMASLAEDPASRREVWKRFHLHHKPLAYAIDRTSGTTPIHQEVPNLIDAKSAYGAIVYQKAPAILHSLAFRLGEENFRAGIQLLLRRHAFSNADWRDLIACFEEVSGHSLGRWADAWINAGGMPCLETHWEIEDGASKRLRLSITQRDSQQQGRNWPVETQICLFFPDGSTRTIRSAFDGPRSAPLELLVDEPPRFIFANDEDYGYGTFLLDDRSLPEVIAEVDHLPDPLRRLLLRGSIGAMAGAGRFDTVELLGLLLRSLDTESDDDLLLHLLDQLTSLTERITEQQLIATIEDRLIKGMMESGSAGQRILFFRTWRRIATTEASTRMQLQILSGDIALPGVTLTPLDRWQIIASLLAFGHPQAERLIQQERQEDQSGDAGRMEWITQAARPDRETKEWYFRKYLGEDVRRKGDLHSSGREPDLAPQVSWSEHSAARLSDLWPEDLPDDLIESSLVNFNHRRHSELTIGFLLPALEALPRLKRERKIFFILAWLNSFIGSHPPASALPIVDRFLTTRQLDPDLTAKIRQIADRYRRPF